MNIALFAQSRIFGSLQSLVRRWTGSDVSIQQRKAQPTKNAAKVAPKSIAVPALMPGATAHNRTKLKPLRVVRVIEAGQNRASIGRIVISGRMADVCAELDRLAAGEAALS
jgi:hypothetical protein